MPSPQPPTKRHAYRSPVTGIGARLANPCVAGEPLVRTAARRKSISRFAGPSQSFWVCGKDTSLLVAKSAFRDQVAGLLVPFDGLCGEVVLRERLLSRRDLIHDPRDRCRRGMAHQLNETRIVA